MEYIECSQDDDRCMIQFWWLQLSLYFDELEDIKKRAKAMTKTIDTFMKYYIEEWTTLDNPFYLMYAWWKDSDINICLQENKDIYLQISSDNIDYFSEEVKPNQLKEIKDLLNKLL